MMRSPRSSRPGPKNSVSPPRRKPRAAAGSWANVRWRKARDRSTETGRPGCRGGPPWPPALQHLARQVRQLRALALVQIDVGVEPLPLDPVDQVGEAVRVGVQVGRVDLVDVAGENDLRVLARAGDDRLHLVRGEVLRL